MFCGQCGAKNEDNRYFCTSCGDLLKEPTPPSKPGIKTGWVIIVASLIVTIGLLWVLKATTGSAPKALQKDEPAVNLEKFDNLYRAAKAVEGATAVGVTYQKFGELLQNFATELFIAQDRIESDSERKAISAYAEILTLYQDSYALWDAHQQRVESLAKYQLDQNAPIIKDALIIISTPERKRIVEKYDIPIGQYQGSNVTTTTSIQLLWTLALKKFTALHEGFKGASD